MMSDEEYAAFQNHTCPTCGHRCLGSATRGRPPKTMKTLLGILREEGSPSSPVSTERIAELMDLAPQSVNTYLSRLRREGYRLATVSDEGYFLINDAPD
jgi:biotin operon repressor